MSKLTRLLEAATLPAFANASNSISANAAEDIHFAAFFLDHRGNYGDRIIPWLAIDLIDHFLPTPPTYRLLHVKSGSTPAIDCDRKPGPRGLIIGPGGLICGRDQKAARSNYKWFANFSSDDALRLKDVGAKIFFWGTGVNRWSKK